MMTMVEGICQRCGKLLTNPKSIERGMGDWCYRQSLQEKKNPNLESINQTLDFLKMEINSIKIFIRNIRNQPKFEQKNDMVIKRIPQKVELRIDKKQQNFSAVVNELNDLFKTVENIKDILKPVPNIQKREAEQGYSTN
jgi:hypothetical protein